VAISETVNYEEDYQWQKKLNNAACITATFKPESNSDKFVINSIV
jgi:hypothetical protein